MQPFTHDHYRSLLRLAKAKFSFAGFRLPKPTQPFVLWRHDCDYSLYRSLDLAKIEHEEGVVSTFFVRIRADAYNVLAPEQGAIARAILDLGHEIGLHYEGVSEGLSDEQLGRRLRDDARILTSAVGCQIDSFSFHQPSSYDLARRSLKIGGLHNSYHREFFQLEKYCSDSNGYWRFASMEAAIRNSGDWLQALTHPELWTRSYRAPRERIVQAALQHARELVQRYDAILEKAGRENRGVELRDATAKLLCSQDVDLLDAIRASSSRGFYVASLTRLLEEQGSCSSTEREALITEVDRILDLHPT